MGAIMSTGVGVANSILVVVFAEERRLLGLSARTAAITGAAARLRPVLMTSIAMICGMIPMALGMSEGGDRTAPLGRAVIGGLICSTTAVLFVLPLVYALVQRNSSRKDVSVLANVKMNGPRKKRRSVQAAHIAVIGLSTALTATLAFNSAKRTNQGICPYPIWPSPFHLSAQAKDKPFMHEGDLLNVAH
jgi:hypothetical protein